MPILVLRQPGATQLLGTSYYISPTGNDANNGLSTGAPWLTPNHAVNAGDTIWAVDGTYSASNFAPGKWGTVTLPSADGQYMAKVRAINPFKCVITASTACMRMDKPGWAVIGFDGTNTSDTDGTFTITPGAARQLHHNAYINCINRGGYRNGFSLYGYTSNKAFGFDYAAIIGCISYNGAQGSSFCFSGISMYQPVLYDATAGVHLYIGGNFSWNNLIPLGGCGGGANSDGNGIILDNWSMSQNSGTVAAYAGAAVVENNICLANGWAGIAAFQSTASGIKLRNNTIWGNVNNQNSDQFYAGDLLINGCTGGAVTVTDNISQANKAAETWGSLYPIYAAYVGLSNGAVSISGNVLNGRSSHHQSSNSSPGFSYGTNSNVDPLFAAAAAPGAPPSVTTQTTTAQVMASVIANFTASAGAAAGKGYQAPGALAANADFPVWLKGAVPSGVISLPAGYAC